MAGLVGTRVVQPLVPVDSVDTYPTHLDIYGKGGYRCVSTIEERNSISLDRQSIGMAVYVADIDRVFTLIELADPPLDQYWRDDGGGIYVSSVPPPSPVVGQLWFNINTSDTLIWSGTVWEIFVRKSVMASDTGTLIINGGYF